MAEVKRQIKFSTKGALRKLNAFFSCEKKEKVTEEIVKTLDLISFLVFDKKKILYIFLKLCKKKN